MTDPRPPGPTGLPVEDVVGDVRSALAGEGVVVLVAEPGAGKTTVLPLRLLGEPWLASGRIIVLEPRRVAARASAQRMAELLGERVGDTVGVVTRDERRVGSTTRIEVVTEGVLTRRIQRDPGLDGVSAVVFDEFHERSLHADLGLAFVLDSRAALRPDLRVVVMSATLDADRVAAHLGGAPVVSSRGRAHTVALEWQPPRARDAMLPSVVTACSRGIGEGAAGVLAFLPGAGEISRVCEALRGQGLDARPLHGGLAAKDQDAALAATVGPRVVVATDVAETSLTVPDVDLVVDSGQRRVPRFDPGSGMSRLDTVPISRAAADQRAGRAGRLGPGRAVRLWSEAEHVGRPEHERPSIAEADLLDLALQVIAWGSTGAEELPFVDAPPAAEMERCFDLLERLGLVADRRVTNLGREVAGLGLHPRLGTVLASSPAGDRDTAAALVALLEERDVLRGPAHERSSDLDDRIQLLRRGKGSLARIARRATRLGARGDPELGRAGALLAAGYPDRIGRNTAAGHFVLTGGMRVSVPEADPLANERWIVAADIEGSRADGRIVRGAGLDPADARRFLAPHATVTADIVVLPERSDVVERTRTTVGPVVLDERIEPASPGPDSAGALARHLLRRGIERLNWGPASEALRRRVALVAQHLGGSWPDLTDAGLEATAAEWLEPLLWSTVAVRGPSSDALHGALRSVLGHDRLREVDRLAPTRVALSGGRELTVDYSGERPKVSARVQDFYGLSSGPRILGGELALTLELLSPARRPVQVTSDLEGFWAGSWSEVRKEMAGRYPKHDWPVDPTNSSEHRRKR